MDARMSERPALPPVAVAVLFGFAAANAALLAGLWQSGGWLLDAAGLPLPVDFALFRAAAELAGQGQAAAVYDPAILKGAEAAVLGRDFAGHYGWHYPPTFLLVVRPLAGLAFLTAELAWTAGTVAALLAVAGLVAGWRGILAALALPPVLACAVVGQTGCLMAALFGAALLVLPRRPVLAGILLGLAATKPHLALLVPVALLAGGERRALIAAAAATLALAAASAVVFGPDAWLAFARDVPAAQASLLGEGIMGFAKLQSAFGAARVAGLGGGGAWAAQAGSTAVAALGVALLWRSAAPMRLKAAGLAAAALLATPYLYLYDLPLLAVTMAFLIRGPLSRPDLGLLGGALGATVLVPVLGAPAGLAASLLAAAAVARQAAPILGAAHAGEARRPAVPGVSPR